MLSVAKHLWIWNTLHHIEYSETSVEDRGAMWDVGVTDVGWLHKK